MDCLILIRRVNKGLTHSSVFSPPILIVFHAHCTIVHRAIENYPPTIGYVLTSFTVFRVNDTC